MPPPGAKTVYRGKTAEINKTWERARSPRSGSNAPRASARSFVQQTPKRPAVMATKKSVRQTEANGGTRNNLALIARNASQPGSTGIASSSLAAPKWANFMGQMQAIAGPALWGLGQSLPPSPVSALLSAVGIVATGMGALGMAQSLIQYRQTSTDIGQHLDQMSNESVLGMLSPDGKDIQLIVDDKSTRTHGNLQTLLKPKLLEQSAVQRIHIDSSGKLLTAKELKFLAKLAQDLKIDINITRKPSEAPLSIRPNQRSAKVTTTSLRLAQALHARGSTNFKWHFDEAECARELSELSGIPADLLVSWTHHGQAFASDVASHAKSPGLKQEFKPFADFTPESGWQKSLFNMAAWLAQDPASNQPILQKVFENMSRDNRQSNSFAHNAFHLAKFFRDSPAGDSYLVGLNKVYDAFNTNNQTLRGAVFNIFLDQNGGAYGEAASLANWMAVLKRPEWTNATIEVIPTSRTLSGSTPDFKIKAQHQSGRKLTTLVEVKTNNQPSHQFNNAAQFSTQLSAGYRGFKSHYQGPKPLGFQIGYGVRQALHSSLLTAGESVIIDVQLRSTMSSQVESSLHEFAEQVSRESGRPVAIRIMQDASVKDVITADHSEFPQAAGF